MYACTGYTPPRGKLLAYKINSKHPPYYFPSESAEYIKIRRRRTRLTVRGLRRKSEKSGRGNARGILSDPPENGICFSDNRNKLHACAREYTIL